MNSKTPEEIVRALRAYADNAQENFEVDSMQDFDAAVDLIESLQDQLADARNELCQRCGRYHEAHKGACDGCMWKGETE